MTAEQRALINYRLERAMETLRDATTGFPDMTLASTVNRVYYAVFYAATAALLTRGVSSRKHSGVLSLFSRTFVKTGLIDKRLGKFYSALFDRRHTGDYDDYVTFEQDDVAQWIEQAGAFIDAARKLALETAEIDGVPGWNWKRSG